MARYNLSKEFTAKFEVEDIKYSNQNFAVCYIKLISYKTSDVLPKKMTLKGYFPTVFKKAVYTATITVEEDLNWGFYLRLKDIPEEVIPNSKRGIAEFLKRNVGKDITVAQAELLVDEMGFDLIDKIKEDKHALDNISFLPEGKKEKIVSNIREHSFFKDLMLKVQGNGLHADVANCIYDKYKEDSLNILDNKPYSLIHIAGLDFTTVDRLAKLNNIYYNDFNRIRAAIFAVIDSFINNRGHIAIPREAVLRHINTFLRLKGYFAKDKLVNTNIVDKIITDMVDRHYLSEEVVGNVSYLYRSNLLTIEKNVAAYIKDFNVKLEIGEILLDSHTIEEFISDYETNYFSLSEGQKNALFMAMQNKFSILTGGPGTGKTQTVNTLLKCLSQYRPDLKVSLMAPTGKASNRMKELTNKDASTIHRGIHFNAFDKNNETIEIDTDYVIIDESSMIDLALFEMLMQNIPRTASILFVGDVDQLPSVGAGNVLKDMIDCGQIPVTRLTEVFRQSMKSNIVMNSHRIMKEGCTITDLSLDDESSDFYIKEKQTVNEILDAVEDTYGKLLASGCSREEICVLAPIEDSEIGNYNLNHIIQEKFNPSIGADYEYQVNDVDVFRVGDRVMQTVNNYDLGVMNGETGIITDISEHNNSGRKEIAITFPNREDDVIYFGGQIKELKLAYACSIHKMQGSEVPYIIHIVHDSQKSMLSRNLVYTAWTRAKKQVIIIGQKQALAKAIRNTQANVRCTLLKERINGEVK